MTRSSLATLAVALALAALAVLPDPAPGCAVAPHAGEYVSTGDESALIVWDEKTKTEHFVRRASFRSVGYDFGFLVPTPTRPHLDVAGDDLFIELSTLTAARVEVHNVVKEVDKEFPLGLGCAPQSAIKAEVAGTEPAAPIPRGGFVEVLEEKKVGDYDATVLTFRRGKNDTPEHGAAEVTKWLAKHGYEASEPIRAWLERYVKDEWCVTAFKVGTKPNEADPHSANQAPNRSAGAHGLRLRPIRMSFKAERPFFPYREPQTDRTKAPRESERLLRVFVAAPARFAGTLGAGGRPWAEGRTVWAGPADGARWDMLFRRAKLTGESALPMPRPGDEWWVTEFEDRSAPRPGTDEVYFEPAADQSLVTRPPMISTNTRTIMRTPAWHAAVYFGVPVALVVSGLGARRLLRRA